MAFDMNESGNFGGSVDTTNDTPTQILAFNMSDFDDLGASADGVLDVRMMIVAGEDAGTGRYARSSRFAVKMVSGTASLLISEVIESESTSAWSAALSITMDTTIVVSVTGAAATNISWRASGQFLYAGYT